MKNFNYEKKERIKLEECLEQYENAKLKDFLNKELENIKNERTYRRFESFDELKGILSKTNINLISEKFRQYQEIYKVILELLSKYIFKIPKRLIDKLSKLNK